MLMTITKTFQSFSCTYDDDYYWQSVRWSEWFRFGERVDIDSWETITDSIGVDLDGVYAFHEDDYLLVDVIINPNQKYIMPNAKLRESKVYKSFLVPKECVEIDEWDGIFS